MCFGRSSLIHIAESAKREVNDQKVVFALRWRMHHLLEQEHRAITSCRSQISGFAPRVFGYGRPAFDGSA